jgi:hypothetical protein
MNIKKFLNNEIISNKQLSKVKGGTSNDNNNAECGNNAEGGDETEKRVKKPNT